MPALNYRKFRLTAIVSIGLLFLSYQSPQSSATGDHSSRLPLPSDLQEQLRQYQLKDQLTRWIYTLLQWTAKAPASRAGSLAQAVGSAWRSPRSDEEIQAWQDLLSNEGYTLLMSGDIVHSTDAYTAAFQWARQHSELADETLVLENILKPLGNNYTRLGDYEQALFIHRKALAIASSLQDTTALAGIFSNLANTSSNMGQPQLSLEYCRQGMQVADRHSALCGLLLSEQADAYQQLQQNKTARISIGNSIAVLESAIAAQKASPETGYWLLMSYQQAGDIYSAQPGASLQFYTKALTLQNRLLQQHGILRKRERAKLFQRLGALYARLNQPARAEYWLDQCLNELTPGKKNDSLQENDLYAENTLLDELFTRAGLYQLQNQPDKALYTYNLCFVTEKKLRNEFITGTSKERSVSDSRLRYETAIAAAWQAWELTGQKKYQQVILEFMESSKSQLLLEEVLRQQQYALHAGPGKTAHDGSVTAGSTPSDSLYNRIRLLEKALVYYQKEALQTGTNDSLRDILTAQEKQTVWDLAELRKKAGLAGTTTTITNPTTTETSGRSTAEAPVTASLPTILPDGQTVRSFFAGKSALYVVECDRSGISFTEKLPLGKTWQDSVRIFTHRYFEEGANAMLNQPDSYYGQAYTIYRQLFGSHPLTPGKEYILLPDGALNLLPVEALVTSPSAPLSPDKWPFVLRQSLISYASSLRTLKEQILTPGNRNGTSGFFLSGNQDNGKSPLLKATAHEKDEMAATIKNGNWYVNEQATTAAFRKALQESALVHISSHAFTKKDSLDAPHIELFDEPFYLFQLKELEAHPALVVLSACRTGDGRMVTGEGVQSLARAFTAGGANAVIAGWWNVNDEVAAQLMKGFYLRLNQPNAAAALRFSKLHWLGDPAIPNLHKLPYYWAALNYQGNPQPLSAESFIESNSRLPSPWWLCLLILPLGILLFTRSHR